MGKIILFDIFKLIYYALWEQYPPTNIHVFATNSEGESKTPKEHHIE